MSNNLTVVKIKKLTWDVVQDGQVVAHIWHGCGTFWWAGEELIGKEIPADICEMQAKARYVVDQLRGVGDA